MNVDITLGFCDSGSYLAHEVHTNFRLPVSQLGANTEGDNINFDVY